MVRRYAISLKVQKNNFLWCFDIVTQVLTEGKKIKYVANRSQKDQ